ncbi:oligosaccharide flippase family protein [Peptostreptococcus porci]|uniref:oligosaccharide flippase family protein n=1 Tax=Peptostreptococcus porci TaxID=2652282 RepID=UPI002A8C756A|nr:oligosaccharide flippase family protein [Peptostreptococcus porci]MDY4669396.1 oligosaccharide flippase family protein [Oliverpabstia sp.]MDY5435554.1 oligosaccharide flippase family protein [Peptostreptococcus porci]
MRNNRNSYLIKNTIIFTIGNLGSKFITFFLIPLYTNALTTSEYGVVDLIATVGTVAIPLLTLNICESVMRFALDRNTDKKQITKIGTYILLISAIIGLGIIPLCTFFDKIANYSIYVYLYVISLAASQLYLCDLRGKELLIYYSVGNILHTFLIAAFNIIYLVVLDHGIEGYLSAFILSNLITATYAIVVGKSYNSFTSHGINKHLLKDMTKYSVVLIPNSFMWWIMNSLDRIMVSSMVGISANGIYAVSYKLPTLVSTLTGIFNQAWSYSAIREEGAKDEAEYNNSIFRKLTGIVTLIGIGLILFSKPFLRFYVAKEYYDAWKYIPFLTVGFVYLTLATFVATSYTVHKDSFGYLFSGMFGAIFNIILNLLLIPSIKVYGAAIATCISYVLVFIFRIIHTRKYIKYSIINKEFLFGSTFLVASSIVVFIDNYIGKLLQISIFVAAIFVFSDIWMPIMEKIIHIKKED